MKRGTVTCIVMEMSTLVRTRTGTSLLVRGEVRKYPLIPRQGVTKMPQSQGFTVGNNPGRPNLEG